MAWKSVTCPNCNASLHVDEVNEFFFCNYCGAQIQRDPSNSFTYRIVDVARIKEAESNERIKQLEIERERKNNDDNRVYAGKIAAVMLIITAIVFGCLVLLFRHALNEEKTEELRLQAIVTEIHQDVDNGNYDEALVKANSLHSNNNKESQERWDKQREDLIKQIEQMKKERDKQ